MSRKGYPSDKQDQFMLRLPDGLRQRIKMAAEASRRSMNAEIVSLLESVYGTGSQLLPVEVIEQIRSGDHPLTAVRRWRGMSLSQLSIHTGIPDYVIRAIEERHERYPSLAFVEAAAKALNVSPDDLL